MMLADPVVTPRSGAAGAALADTAEAPSARAPATTRADTRIETILHRVPYDERGAGAHNSRGCARESPALWCRGKPRLVRRMRAGGRLVSAGDPPGRARLSVMPAGIGRVKGARICVEVAVGVA